MRESRSDATSPAISEIARPWKIGSNRMTAAPTIMAAAVSAMGRNRTAPASTTACSSGNALEQPQFDEVHQDDRIAHDDARTGDEADHRRGREERAHRRVRRQDADQRERNGGHDQQGRLERLEPADHQQIDQQEHGREREAEVAEHFDRELPLAVPLHRVTRGVERLDRVEDFEPIPLGERQPSDRPVHLEDGVHRAPVLSRQVPGDIGHRL